MFTLEDLQLNSSGRAKRSKQAKKIERNQGVWGMLGTFIWWYLRIFTKPLLGEFWGVSGKHSFHFKDFWGDLASCSYSALFIFLSPFSEIWYVIILIWKKPYSCVMDLHVKQATTTILSTFPQTGWYSYCILCWTLWVPESK